MMIKLTSRLFVLLLVVAFTFLFPGMTVASANNIFASSKVILTSLNEEIRDTITFAIDDLTPQERQKLQAVRQRRNKEITAVLDANQRTELTHQLHIGNNLNQALETLDLNSEQQSLINAVIEFTNLKLKGIFSRHILLDGHQ